MRTVFMTAGVVLLLFVIAGGVYGIAWFFWGEIGDNNGRCGDDPPRRRPRSSWFDW